MASNVFPHQKITLSSDDLLIIQNTITLWTQLADELMPIIGKDGFAMLYARSLLLTRSEFDWLPAGQVLEPAAMRLDRLKSCLLKQPTKSSEGSQALLNNFTDTLTVLIGEPLIVSILHAAWGDTAPVVLARNFKS